MSNPTRPPERWKTIPDKPANGRYDVSTEGRVRHVYGSGKIKMISAYPKRTIRKGSTYYLVKICRKEVKVAHLVFTTFRGPIPEGKCIIHRNGLKEDNSIYNLVCVSKEKVGEVYGKKVNTSRPIAKINSKGEYLEIYRSHREAARKNPYINRQSILDRCNGKVKIDIYLPDGTTFVYADQ